MILKDDEKIIGVYECFRCKERRYAVQCRERMTWASRTTISFAFEVSFSASAPTRPLKYWVFCRTPNNIGVIYTPINNSLLDWKTSAIYHSISFGEKICGTLWDVLSLARMPWFNCRYLRCGGVRYVKWEQQEPLFLIGCQFDPDMPSLKLSHLAHPNVGLARHVSHLKPRHCRPPHN